MAQYTNNIHIALNANKTEMFINFSLDSVNSDNEKVTAPVSDIILRSDMAESMATMILQLLHRQPDQTN